MFLLILHILPIFVDCLSGGGNSQPSNSTPSSGSGASSKSRLSVATLKTTNFFASFNPARWGRHSERTSQKVSLN